MNARVGDRIVVDAQNASTSQRAGVVEEILEGEKTRFLVRWDEGRTSLFSPSAGCARIEPARRRKRQPSRRGTSGARQRA